MISAKSYGRFKPVKIHPVPTHAETSDAAVPTAPETVILVHGLWMTGLEMQWLARGLRREGYRVRTFRYPSVRMNIAENARRLARFHEQVIAGDAGGAGAARTHLVGHSLGGLVITQMLRDHPGRIPSVGRVVTLGTPFLGSVSAKVISGLPLGTNVVGQCFPEAAEAARLPETLPCQAWDFAVDLGVVAGNRSFGIGRLLNVFSSPNDGVVAVEETELPGAADHLVLPINHAALTFSERVVRQTSHFLRHGCFHRPQESVCAEPAHTRA